MFVVAMALGAAATLCGIAAYKIAKLAAKAELAEEQRRREWESKNYASVADGRGKGGGL